MRPMRPARQHLARLHQLATLAREGARDPRVRAAGAALQRLPSEEQVPVLQLVMHSFAYLDEDQDRLATVDQVLERGGDDCDGLAMLTAAVGLAADLPVVFELYRQPDQTAATHVAARVAGELVDPTPAPPQPWVLTGPGPLAVTCCDDCGDC